MYNIKTIFQWLILQIIKQINKYVCIAILHRKSIEEYNLLKYKVLF